MPSDRTPRRWQFSLGQIMLAVVVAAFDCVVILHGALIYHQNGRIGFHLLRNYVANTTWPTLAVIVTVVYLRRMVWSPGSSRGNAEEDRRDAEEGER